MTTTAPDATPAPTRAKKRPAIKHVPERTCVACRTSRPKRHLVRVVRTAEGNIEVDRTGRKAGRGAYLCPAQECWRLARARRSLDQALSVVVTADAWDQLDAYAERLPETRDLTRLHGGYYGRTKTRRRQSGQRQTSGWWRSSSAVRQAGDIEVDPVPSAYWRAAMTPDRRSIDRILSSCLPS